MTRECFTKWTAIFFKNFRGIKSDKSTLDIWYELLKELTDEQYKFAIKKICTDVKEFYPTTNFVAVVFDTIKTDIRDIAMMSWCCVVKTMGLSGAYSSVEFSDPVIHSVIEYMGGWIDFCHTPINRWMRKEFADTYISMSKKQSHSKYLKGIFEIDNRANGHEDKILKPKFIKVEQLNQKEITKLLAKEDADLLLTESEKE